ncbi:MAG: hypothetical protein IK094_05890 [Treponema sp.]|nr:hypothetical protein [Treponema sp.]
MLMIAFWLAIATFFVPKKYKKICGWICIGICLFSTLTYYFGSRFTYNRNITLRRIGRFCFFFWRYHEDRWSLCDFGWKISPFGWIKHLRYLNHRLRIVDLVRGRISVFVSIESIIQIALAFAAMKVSLNKYIALIKNSPLAKYISIIKNKIVEEYEKRVGAETSSDIVSSAADGRLLRVVEVNAGLCTGTLRGSAIETKINQMASQGWKFEHLKTIIGRCCLFFPRYKAMICFSKTN